MSEERRKVRIGTVVQDKMDMTVVVMISWKRPHRIYKKPVRRRSRLYAHDSTNECRVGDTVSIIETRPLSKTKRWRVTEILSRIEIAEVQPHEIAKEIVERNDVQSDSENTEISVVKDSQSLVEEPPQTTTEEEVGADCDQNNDGGEARR